LSTGNYFWKEEHALVAVAIVEEYNQNKSECNVHSPGHQKMTIVQS